MRKRHYHPLVDEFHQCTGQNPPGHKSVPQLIKDRYATAVQSKLKFLQSLETEYKNRSSVTSYISRLLGNDDLAFECEHRYLIKDISLKCQLCSIPNQLLTNEPTIAKINTVFATGVSHQIVSILSFHTHSLSKDLSIIKNLASASIHPNTVAQKLSHVLQRTKQTLAELLKVTRIIQNSFKSTTDDTAVQQYVLDDAINILEWAYAKRGWSQSGTLPRLYASLKCALNRCGFILECTQKTASVPAHVIPSFHMILSWICELFATILQAWSEPTRQHDFLHCVWEFYRKCGFLVMFFVGDMHFDSCVWKELHNIDISIHASVSDQKHKFFKEGIRWVISIPVHPDILSKLSFTNPRIQVVPLVVRHQSKQMEDCSHIQKELMYSRKFISALKEFIKHAKRVVKVNQAVHRLIDTVERQSRISGWIPQDTAVNILRILELSISSLPVSSLGSVWLQEGRLSLFSPIEMTILERDLEVLTLD